MLLTFVIAAKALNNFFGGKFTESDERLTETVDSRPTANSGNGNASEHSSTAGRLLGSIEVDGEVIFLAEDAGFLLPISPSAVTGKGIASFAELDGKRYLFNIYQKPKESDL